ncbi:hypothetical protein N0V90_008060 [Kalmusia sp. IMI 367209]|nr:hypothetical protein N0V90_008060 [Kalmusia sp. IMI 367209]
MSSALLTPPQTAFDAALDVSAKDISRALEKALQPSTLTPLPTPARETPPLRNSPDALAELDASLLKCTYTTNPRTVPTAGSAAQASMKVCTDHMIQAQWTSTTGWAAPTLQPYGPLNLMPTASALHYATQCFEGMKLYRGFDGKLRLFRPQLNCNRMVMSTSRIALPSFPPAELLALIAKLCATDGEKWLPANQPGSFLYIRPAMIATDSALGVQKPSEALLMVILTCFPPLDDLSGGMHLLASREDMVRAWPGGFGYAKVGANYGPSLVAQGEARRQGFHQILWLFGEEGTVTEAGASNFFVVWRTREGRLQLVTAGLDERIVLDGVTRRSVLELARERLTAGSEFASGLESVEVVERKYTIGDLVEAADEGRLIEAFGAGTAWFVAPISKIQYKGKDIEVPMGEGDIGAYTRALKGWLKGIMWGLEGNTEHEWGYVIDEEKRKRMRSLDDEWDTYLGLDQSDGSRRWC